MYVFINYFLIIINFKCMKNLSNNIFLNKQNMIDILCHIKFIKMKLFNFFVLI